MNKFFIYYWTINPEESRMVGPYTSRDEAVEWAEDRKEDFIGQQVAIIEVPFFEDITQILEV